MSQKDLRPRRPVASLHDWAITLLFILTILAAAMPAAANQDPVISGNTATYSGNQQPDPIIQNGTSIYNIYVQDLTTNVGSSSTDTSISLTNTGSHGPDQGNPGGNAKNLLLSYSGGNFYLYGNNYGAYLNTTAGSGHDGGSHNAKDNQHGGDGGNGGTGGTATVTTSGAIQVSGIGIGALSNGGAAGNGSKASGAENQYGGTLRVHSSCGNRNCGREYWRHWRGCRWREYRG